MSITVHQRPGVYSSYDASTVVSGSGSGRLVGLVAVNTIAQAGVAQTITSYDQAVTTFGSTGGEDMAELIRLILKNGASGVVAVPVENESGYEPAFTLLAGIEDLALVVCDSTQESVHQRLKQSVISASQLRRERLGVVAGAADESVEELTARAKNLNCERMILVAPGCVDQDGESRVIRSADTVIQDAGTYRLTVYDQAGNSTVYEFTIHLYLNLSAIAAIGMILAGLAVLLAYSRYIRTHPRVG